MSADIQSLVASLQEALGIRIACGQITLNMNDGRIESVETKTKSRIVNNSRQSVARHVHDFCRYEPLTDSYSCPCGVRDSRQLTKSAT